MEKLLVAMRIIQVRGLKDLKQGSSLENKRAAQGCDR